MISKSIPLNLDDTTQGSPAFTRSKIFQDLDSEPDWWRNSFHPIRHSAHFHPQILISSFNNVECGVKNREFGVCYTTYPAEIHKLQRNLQCPIGESFVRNEMKNLHVSHVSPHSVRWDDQRKTSSTCLAPYPETVLHINRIVTDLGPCWYPRPENL